MKIVEKLFKQGEQHLLFEDDSDHLTLAQVVLAIICFEQVVAIHPNHHRAWYELANLYSREAVDEQLPSRFAQALAAISRATELYPDDSGYWLIRAGIIRDLIESTKEYGSDSYRFLRESVTELYPSLEAAREDLLFCYDQELRLLESQTRHNSVLYSKANVLQDLEQYAEAIEVYESLFELEKNNDFAKFNKSPHFHLAFVYEKLEDYQKALEHYEQYELTKSDQTYSPLTKTRFLEKLGRHDEAQQLNEQMLVTIDEQIERHGEDAAYYRMKANIYEQLGRKAEAVAAYKRQLETMRYSDPEKMAKAKKEVLAKIERITGQSAN